MKKLIILSLIALTMLNCKNKEQKTETSNTGLPEVTATATPLALGCYVFNDGKSTVSLEITQNDAAIKGNLTYALSEKDKNSGTFTGQVKDGVLIANYTFQSEGKESTRQIAFKVNKDTLTEGYGELNSEGTAFKDVNSLSFTSNMPLTKTDCSKLND